MKKKKFPLIKVLKYRSYLEKNQALQFRDAMRAEEYIETVLSSNRDILKKRSDRKDALISEEKLDINKIKATQEQILFAQIDDTIISSELVKASNNKEVERKKWIERKGESDAIDKLKDKFVVMTKKEMLDEDQKETDEIARQCFLRGGNK